MQRFRFRLASVLSWRALQLEVQETQFRALFAERARIEAEIKQLGESRREADRTLTLPSVDGQDLAALDAHRHGLARAVERLRASSADCERRIAEQRAKVVEAERQVRLLERLKERRLAEWQTESDRELETLASEAFLAKWVRER